MAEAMEQFLAQRAWLVGLAYRLLGSAADAEDVVQDAFVRWNRVDHAVIASPSAWLAKVVTNLCLNRLASARLQREVYAGPWLPEPVLTADGGLGPLDSVAQRESVSMALLLLLERLTPTERAVFVLHEAFAYGYREIAGIVELSESNCRQLNRRARQRVGQRQPRFRPDTSHWQRLVERFLAAAREGDLRALELLLAADVVTWADGGGKITAARRPVTGRTKVARYIAGGIGRLGTDVEALPAEINGQPGLVGLCEGVVVGVIVLEMQDDLIGSLRIVANPGKLRFIALQLAMSHSAALAGS